MTVIPIGILLRLLPTVSVFCGISALRSITALLPAENVVVTVISIGNLLWVLPTVSVCCGSSAMRSITVLLPAENVCCDSNTHRKFTGVTAYSKCVLWQ